MGYSPSPGQGASSSSMVWGENSITHLILMMMNSAVLSPIKTSRDWEFFAPVALCLLSLLSSRSPGITRMSEDAPDAVAAYLRISALSVALFEWARTLPTVLSIYNEQRRARRITVTGASLFLLRQSCILALALSNGGFFGAFTSSTCRWYYILPPIAKILVAAISQGILGIRASKLSRRSRQAGVLLTVFYVATVVLQATPTLFGRHPIIDENRGTYTYCVPARLPNERPILGGPYTFYAVAISYDIIVTGVSIYFLMVYKRCTKDPLMKRISSMLITDGAAYLLAVTAVNIANVVVYKVFSGSPLKSTAVASLWTTSIWMMTQKLLLHLHAASIERRTQLQQAKPAELILPTIPWSFGRASIAHLTRSTPRYSLHLTPAFPRAFIESHTGRRKYADDVDEKVVTLMLGQGDGSAMSSFRAPGGVEADQCTTCTMAR
ncbi:hypothetical protein BDV98DRAFT_558484 [Pterulicium gracile]|uniref:Uncharacterized protein n=1 Tax=Pterulicium gracile TaxID=1884261 RepID=A0A5C3R0L7_9AGAR|nr:hypothetical protein BDV98DRAFT_558484 [Pterula gracilis]